MTLEFKLGSMTQSIHQLFEQQVQRTPEAMALIGENRQISYESLNQKANQLNHYLQKCGLKSDCSGKKIPILELLFSYGGSIKKICLKRIPLLG
ncbi:linear gramicidin synthase subunit D [Microcystis aeruginosa NIES-2521]|uniref:Linear gramicidin synthase subunit D n=2 Tax=Microcystis TaxID=1125 RepID=A0A5A5RY91_MICAE|nr:hypothetical protein [Microcystis aeruginosa]AZP89554.1 hypothetical protein [Microcystis sp. PCC 10613]GCA78077.1 linear gramicidin synthase subunit D [Microcystis aeruginosa NIES-2521]